MQKNCDTTGTKRITAIVSVWAIVYIYLLFAYGTVDSQMKSIFILFGSISAAEAAVRREIESLRDEINAFIYFSSRVEKLQPTTVCLSHDQIVLNRTQLEQSANEVQTLYGDIIMGTSDFKEVYDEDLQTHMSNELSTDVAKILDAGQPITSELQNYIIQRSLDAAEKRRDLLSPLNKERASLHRARETFNFVDNTINQVTEKPLWSRELSTLGYFYKKMSACYKDCEHLISNRQSEIHAVQPRYSNYSDALFQEYLYGELENCFPVLSGASERLNKINRVQQEVTADVLRR